MNQAFDITTPLSLANIRACATACAAAYAFPTFTDGESQESVCIQAVDDILVIAYPGTEDFRDVLRDIEVDRIAANILANPCSVHRGFDASFNATLSQVVAMATEHRDKKIFVTGHSKGAAVAKRCALALIQRNIPVFSVITFGEPRGGDARYAEIYHSALGERTLRITNAADLVPWMPAWSWPWSNRHCGTEGYLPPGENQIVDGPRLAWKLARNCGEIYRGWKAIWDFKRNPDNLANEALNLTQAVRDHFLASYQRRLDALN